MDPVNFTDFEVSELTQDTRKVRPGAVFVAIKGSRIDGHRLIGQAIAKGARLIVAQEMVEANVPVVYVHDTHRALAELAANFYGQPSRRLQVIGVTGTNGKTTVTHLIEKNFSGSRPINRFNWDIVSKNRSANLSNRQHDARCTDYSTSATGNGR